MTYSKMGLVFLGSAMMAAAAPIPFVADDTSVVGLNQYELTVASQHLQTAEGWVGNVPSVAIKYGIFPNLEVGITSALDYNSPAHTGTATGYGDTQLNAKYNLLSETVDLPAVSLAAIYLIPTGNQKDGLGSGHNDAYFPLWLQKTFGAYTVDVGGGYGINPGAGNKNWEYVGASIQRQLTDKLTAGVEIYNRSAISDTAGSDFAFNVGAGYQLAANQSLSLTTGRSFVGSTDFQATLSYRYTFGN